MTKNKLPRVNRRVANLGLTVVLPCLNEEATVGACVTAAKKWIGKRSGEVIVVDNGSTDRSARLARQAGARVVKEKTPGYGAAIYRGLLAAKGEYLFIADADLSYDLGHLSPFLKRLKAGADLVIGNRFAGGIQPGAMPWLHRYVGNPVLTFLANLFFGTQLGDYHSGVRAVRKSVLPTLQLQCVGMEFASEMIVRAKLHNLVVDEVAVPYRPDGRNRKSHIRTFRDGWRHLRFLMLFAPNFIFFYPAVIILITSLSLLAYMVVESLHLGRVALGIHTMLVLGALLIIGYQLLHWTFCVRVFARQIKLPVRSPRIVEKLSALSLELSMLIGGLVFLIGLFFCGLTLQIWLQSGLGDLNPEETMRVFIPGIILVVLGVQIFFSTLFLGILNFEQFHARE